MKAIMISVLATITLAGCAGKILNGNPSSVTIKHDGSYSAATKLAVQHCAQYDKDARLIHTEGFIMSFDCLKRE